MENVIHMDPPERPEKCACEGSGPTLAVLQEVQRAYEQRMDMLERVPGTPINRLQLKVDLLRSWVADLVGQNTLLARAVEELEAEATTRLFMEERKHNEMVCELRAELAVFRRRLVRKDSDLRGLIEVLRRLREFDYCTLEGIHFCEVTESDIFGSDDWQHKMAQGDAQHNVKQNPSKSQITKHRHAV